MPTVVLIHPGETEFDQQGRIQGTLDIPLSQAGLAESQRLADELRELGLAALYASPCESAWQTAAGVAAALGIKARQLDALANLDLGLWQGTLIDDVRRKQPKVYRQWQEHPESVCPPEGESLAAAQKRVAAGLAKLLRKHKASTIGLVVPEPLAALVRSHLLSAELGDLWKGCGRAGTWERLEVNGTPVAGASPAPALVRGAEARPH